MIKSAAIGVSLATRSVIRAVRRPGLFALASGIAGAALGGCVAASEIQEAVNRAQARFPDYGRLAVLSRLWTDGTAIGGTSAVEFRDWRDANTAFEQLAAVRRGPADVIGLDSFSGELASVTYNWFDTLGVRPTRGRLFERTDANPESAPSAVLSQRAALRAFGGPDGALDRLVRLRDAAGERAYRVIGVVGDEASFVNRDRFDAYVLEAEGKADHEPTARLAMEYVVIGKTRPDRSLDDASRWLSVTTAELSRRYPQGPPDRGGLVTPLREFEFSGSSAAIRRLRATTAVAAVAGVFNMCVLGVALARRREASLRVHMTCGAGPLALCAAQVGESAVWSLASSGVAFVTASVVGPVLLASLGGIVPEGAISATMSHRAAAAAAGGAAVFVLSAAIGLISVASVSLPVPRSHRGTWKAEWLLGLQVMVLVPAAAVLAALAAGYVRMLNVPLGFDPAGVVAVHLSTPTRPVAGEARGRLTIASLEARLRTFGSRGLVAFTDRLPVSGGPVAPTAGLEVGGRRVRVVYRIVTAPYFELLSVPLQQGRTAASGAGCEFVANRALKEVIDRTPESAIRFGGELCLLAGVAGNVREYRQDREPQPTMYVPFFDESLPPRLWALFRPASAERAVSAVTELRTLFRDQAVVDPIGLASHVLRWTESTRSYLVLALTATVVGVLGMSLGVLSVTAETIRQRAHESAIRVALGAPPFSIALATVGQLSAILGIAGLAGAAAALLVLRQVDYLFYGTTASWWTAGLAAGTVLTCAAAALIPTVRLVRRLDLRTVLSAK